MVLGHLTCTYLVYRALEKKGIRLRLPALLVGAYLPDIIDKPLNLILTLSVHGIGHSFFVLLLLFTPLILVLKNYRGIIAALGFGCLLHLLGDVEQTVSILWPFAGDVGFEGERFSLYEALYGYYVQREIPVTLSIEVLSILGCIFLIAYERIKGRYMFDEGKEVKRYIEVEEETV